MLIYKTGAEQLAPILRLQYDLRRLAPKLLIFFPALRAGGCKNLLFCKQPPACAPQLCATSEPQLGRELFRPSSSTLPLQLASAQAVRTALKQLFPPTNPSNAAPQVSICAGCERSSQHHGDSLRHIVLSMTPVTAARRLQRPRTRTRAASPATAPPCSLHVAVVKDGHGVGFSV